MFVPSRSVFTDREVSGKLLVMCVTALTSCLRMGKGRPMPFSGRMDQTRQELMLLTSHLPAPLQDTTYKSCYYLYYLLHQPEHKWGTAQVRLIPLSATCGNCRYHMRHMDTSKEVPIILKKALENENRLPLGKDGITRTGGNHQAMVRAAKCLSLALPPWLCTQQ